MEGIFIKLLNLSIQASILITVVLLLRFILNKSPKSIKCLLWALVAIRLVCPFSIESKFSLAPDAEVVSINYSSANTETSFYNMVSFLKVLFRNKYMKL